MKPSESLGKEGTSPSLVSCGLDGKGVFNTCSNKEYRLVDDVYTCICTFLTRGCPCKTPHNITDTKMDLTQSILRVGRLDYAVQS